MTTTALDGINITFPEGVYSDVRLERTATCDVVEQDGALQDVRRRTEAGALLRVSHGGRWYYASTTDLATLDAQLETLASLARSGALGTGPDAATPTPHQARVLRFADVRIDRVPLAEKLAVLRGPLALLDRESVRTWRASWTDTYRLRRFVSSAGADVTHDYQICGCRYDFSMADGDETFQESFQVGATALAGLTGRTETDRTAFTALLERCERFVAEAEAVVPGTYPVIMAPRVAGVFAHESFGHKSEADFMLGDPTMLESWKLGSQVGSEVLSIVDDGSREGSGYVPYDDEGQPSQKTWLIRDGKLTGRLHSQTTAAALGESHTGNARAMSFRFEPIVRMTTTTIEPGAMSREALFAGVEDGYYVETFKHGSGMSRFTIAPRLAWRIRGGELAEPVRIAVLTGTVFETLGEIDGVSDAAEVEVMPFGGCGKGEQYPLNVSFGGPFVRVARLEVS